MAQGQSQDQAYASVQSYLGHMQQQQASQHAPPAFMMQAAPQYAASASPQHYQPVPQQAYVQQAQYGVPMDGSSHR